MSYRWIIVGAAALASVASACHRQLPEDEHIAHMTPGDIAGQPLGAPNARQGSPSLPPSDNNAKARLAASPRHGEWVKVPWGGGTSDSLMAWIVYPSTNR